MRNTFDTWKKIAHAIGSMQTTLLLSLFYWLLITPLGILYQRTVGKKLISSQATWRQTTIRVDTIEQARKLG